MVNLKIKVEVHGVLSNLVARIINLQGTYDKENVLENAKSTEEQLSYQVTASKETLEKERKSHREQVKKLKNEYDDVVDDDINGVMNVFQRSYNQFEIIFLEVEIPQEKMGLWKKIVYGDITSDREEEEENWKSEEEAK